MARSSFKLPGIQELHKQQRSALDLPLEGQHLIVGGPGTGKSVIALLRARRLANENIDYLFLVYNILLDKNSYGLGGHELKAATWKKWFKDSFPKWFDDVMPIDSANNENWSEILGTAPSKNIDSLPYLIIDEGQDMPPEFYKALINIGFENFYVVADQNQRISEYNSSRQDLERSLDLCTSKVLELTSNYRNSLPIARLAQAFFTNDPASPLVELPKTRVGERIPLMVRYGNNMGINFSQVIKQILNTYDRNSNKLICIITANDSIRRKFCEALRNDRVQIQTYSSNYRTDDPRLIGMISKESCARCGAQMKTKKGTNGIFWGCTNFHQTGCNNSKPYVNIDFGNGGIAVINQQSIKGLEFDTVYIADIDTFQDNDRDSLMKKFYVMVSRAREDIFFLRTGEISRHVEEILPNDETILERR